MSENQESEIERGMSPAAPLFGEWRGISTAPLDGTHIIVGWFGIGQPNFGFELREPYRPIPMQTAAHFFELDWYASVQTSDGEPLMQPTHWTPLLPPPNE